jgi:regulator of RNase E activity RraA
LITSGGGRDLLQVRALDYPIFSGCSICSHGYSQIVEIGCPIRVGGLVVRSGDLLHGDANGVANVPIQLASEIADAAAEFIAAENHVLNYVKSEAPMQHSEFAARRAAMTESIAALRQRVSRAKS